MDAGATGTLRRILHAAARVLGCGSVQMALIDRQRHALVVRVAVSIADVERFQYVESLLGFATDGLAISLSEESSLIVRAAVEGRTLVTARFADIAGTLVDEGTVGAIESVIGRQTFAFVPVIGRDGPLAVLIFVKPGESGFAPADRDLLVAYADRVGAALEGHDLDSDVEVLESLSDPSLRPPIILLCDEALRIHSGEHDGQPLARMLHAEAAESALREALARRGETVRSLAVTTDDGRSLRISLRPATFSWGLGHVAVVEDVTWLERLSREAARARDHLARVLGTVGDAVLTLDNVGAIVGCNAAVRAVFDAQPADVLGRPITDLLADARACRRAAMLRKRLSADGFTEGELTFRRGGRTIPAAVSALLLADDQGHPTGSLWRVRDLSARRRGDAERRRLRARLLRSERLSALGEMAARIAHEVRNPLVSIGAAAQLVLEELEHDSPVRADVEAIGREVRRLDGIVSGFLDVARPSGISRARPAREPADLAALVSDTISLLRARGDQVRFEITASGAAHAVCDGDRIRQVLWNVLSNAVEASPPGGRVGCDVRARDGWVIVTINDEGRGIPASVRRHVFDPFFSTKARGTGLGLAISRQIVEEHHGRLRLGSRRGGGTRVVIELPGDGHTH